MKSGATPAQMWSQVPTANKVASVIKSIQRGVIYLGPGGVSTTTATITAVVMAKSVVLWGGSDFNINGGYYTSSHTKMVLTNTTTVTVSRAESYYSSAANMPYQVVEYY